MAGNMDTIVRVFAVSLEQPISFLVERGLQNAHQYFTSDHRLSEPEVSDWIARALTDLLSVEHPELHQGKNPERKYAGQMEYFSNTQNALLQFVDFGYTGIEVKLTTNAQEQDRMTVGTLSSYPGLRKRSSIGKNSRRSAGHLAKLNKSFKATMLDVAKAAKWDVDAFVIKGIHHVLLQLEDVEGLMVMTFPKMMPLLEQLKDQYTAKANEERERQVMEELDAGNVLPMQQMDAPEDQEGVDPATDERQAHDQGGDSGQRDMASGDLGKHQAQGQGAGNDEEDDGSEEEGGSARGGGQEGDIEACEKCREGDMDHYHLGDPKPRGGVALEEWYMMNVG
ncbi:hypothetical protein LTR36_009180 [Oleoguttula mirabilis]|uniref:Uncharacterized protein n=1 Tax=Oleoguttula mirabilis TaxID=1507867 RepID=A0AAV9J6Z1_9PEZI|nr:hypothetical protein LTR36_009180 [Oleoguttula mirabilis]